MRMVRSSMLESIRQDYVATAKAKGQKDIVIIFKHVFRNAMLPTITVVGNNFAKLLGGAAVTEIVFSVPGIGKLIVDAIMMKNAPLVQGGILFLAFLMSFVNLLVDIIYAYVDPRIRSQFTS
jgi:peptide/nickel transport system permease protein